MLNFAFTRRNALLAAAIFVGSYSSAANASDDWKGEYPTITVSVVPNENQADVMARNSEFGNYLAKALGVKVEVTTASDYAGTIEALRAKKAQIAYFGAASYVTADQVTNGNVEPLATRTDAAGNTGYRSVIVVKSDSPYKTLEDLKGKTLAFADPNSTSGYQVPNYYLRTSGIVPETYFSRVGFSGSHENGVLAVVNGTYDSAATWYNSEDNSNITRMASKDLIGKDDLRVIWKSDEIPDGPYVTLKDLPTDMKAAIKAAILAFPEEAPDAWKALTSGKSLGMKPVSASQYEGVAKVMEMNKKLRRSAGN